MDDWDERKPSLVFECEDIEQAHKEMAGRGVEFSQEPKEMPWGMLLSFWTPKAIGMDYGGVTNKTPYFRWHCRVAEICEHLSLILPTSNCLQSLPQSEAELATAIALSISPAPRLHAHQHTIQVFHTPTRRGFGAVVSTANPLDQSGAAHSPLPP